MNIRFLICVVIAFVVMCLFGECVRAADHLVDAKKMVSVRIPDSAALYRHQIEQTAGDVWGMNASPARLAAQGHEESRLNPKALAPDGGEGMYQFMPETSRWIADMFPKQLGRFDPWDPAQAILGAALYDKFLFDHQSNVATNCDRWAFTLSAYNGGLGWVQADQTRAQRLGIDGARWFGFVEYVSSRSVTNRSINRHYVADILLVVEPAYIAAGWPGAVACP